MSIASTRQPAARNICKASNPSNPMPITATRSPSAGAASRTAFIAMAPSIANAASSKATFAGIGTTRFRGTEMTSAWPA